MARWHLSRATAPNRVGRAAACAVALWRGSADGPQAAADAVLLTAIAALTAAWDFAADPVPASAITLYAKWSINSYTVSFDSAGGTAVPAVTDGGAFCSSGMCVGVSEGRSNVAARADFHQRRS